MPADAKEYKARQRQVARSLVKAAPSLCAALDSDLLELIAIKLAPKLHWPAVPSPRATAFLPPADDRFGGIGNAASSDRIFQLDEAQDTQEVQPLHAESAYAAWQAVVADLRGSTKFVKRQSRSGELPRGVPCCAKVSSFGSAGDARGVYATFILPI